MYLVRDAFTASLYISNANRAGENTVSSIRIVHGKRIYFGTIDRHGACVLLSSIALALDERRAEVLPEDTYYEEPFGIQLASDTLQLGIESTGKRLPKKGKSRRHSIVMDTSIWWQRPHLDFVWLAQRSIKSKWRAKTDIRIFSSENRSAATAASNTHPCQRWLTTIQIEILCVTTSSMCQFVTNPVVHGK